MFPTYIPADCGHFFEDANLCAVGFQPQVLQVLQLVFEYSLLL